MISHASRGMKPPGIVNATRAELDELLAKAKPTFTAQEYLLLERVFGTFVYVMLKLRNAKTSIKRFRQMLFGARTEHKRNVLENVPATEPATEPTTEPGNDAGVAESADGCVAAQPVRNESAALARVGHGRNGAQVYEGAAVVEIDCPDSQPGDACPKCETGKVYDTPPRTIVKVTGQPPLVATVYKLKRLRCRLCDAIFAAPMTEAIACLPKYDPACASMIALASAAAAGCRSSGSRGRSAPCTCRCLVRRIGDPVGHRLQGHPRTARGRRRTRPPGRSGRAAPQRRHPCARARSDG